MCLENLAANALTMTSPEPQNRLPYFAGSPEFAEFIYYEYFFVLRHIRNLFEAYFMENRQMTIDEQILKFDYRLDQWKHFFTVKLVDNEWKLHPYTHNPSDIHEVYRDMNTNATNAIQLFSAYTQQPYVQPPKPI